MMIGNGTDYGDWPGDERNARATIRADYYARDLQWIERELGDVPVREVTLHNAGNTHAWVDGYYPC